MSKLLHVGIDLPLGLVVQKNAILGTTGAGKSNGAVAIAEEMHAAGVPWVAIDPKGDWYGVRSSSDGKGPGLDVPVIGGEYGDIPLSPDSGKQLGELVAKGHLRGVIDISDFESPEEKARFMADFGRALLRHRKTAIHIFCDECHEYMPQDIISSAAKACVNVWMQIATKGRQKGIGFTLLSQRPALVNKTCLYMCENLFAMRMSGERDKAAIKGWTPGPAKDLVGTLHELKSGEAWLWSPSALERTERFRFRRRSTFDSGRTPEVGESLIAPELAQIDLGALRELLATPSLPTSDEELRRDNERLRVEAQQLRKENAEQASCVETYQIRVGKLEECIARLRAVLGDAPSREAGPPAVVVGVGGAIYDRVERPDRSGTELRLRPTSAHLFPASAEPVAQVAEMSAEGPTGLVPNSAQTDLDLPTLPSEALAELGNHGARILQALALAGPMSLKEAALLAGFSPASSSVDKAAAKCQRKGYVEGKNARLSATPAGRVAIGNVDQIPAGRPWFEFWALKLPKAERDFLTALVECFPQPMELRALAIHCGHSATSSSVEKASARLKRLGLANGTNAALSANERLVDRG